MGSCVRVIWSKEGCSILHGHRAGLEDSGNALYTSISGRVANSPVMGSWVLDVYNLVLADLKRWLACEDVARRDLHRAAARFTERNEAAISRS